MSWTAAEPRDVATYIRASSRHGTSFCIVASFASKRPDDHLAPDDMPAAPVKPFDRRLCRTELGILVGPSHPDRRQFPTMSWQPPELRRKLGIREG